MGKLVWAISSKLESIVSGPLPEFLHAIDFNVAGARLYAIDH